MSDPQFKYISDLVFRAHRRVIYFEYSVRACTVGIPQECKMFTGSL